MARVLVDISVPLLIVFNTSRMCLSREAQKNTIIPGHLGKQENMTLLFVVCLMSVV